MAGNLKLTGKLAGVALKMLKDVCQILDKCQIPYNLEGGTLLGIIRENRLLPWDNDMDLTIRQEFLEKLVKNRWRFWLAGYRTRIRYSKKDTPYYPKGCVRMLKIQTRHFLFKGHSLLDIFIKIKDKDQYFWMVDEKNPMLKSVSAHYYESLSHYEFEGYSYLIPADYEDYLTCRYGDWKTPVKEYNYKKDDHAILKV